MSTIEQTSQPQDTTSLPGDILRAKREEKGLSLEEIATRLRLKVSTVEKLEANDIADEQVATFVRGYYKSYAKLVGISETDIAAATKNLLGSQVKQQPMTSFSKGAHKARHNKRMSSLSWAIFIAIAGISAVWYWQSLQHSSETTETEISQEVATDANNDISTTEIEPADNASDVEQKAPILVEKEAISEMADVNAAEAIEAQARGANQEQAADQAQTEATTTADAIAQANATDTPEKDQETTQVAENGMKKLVLNFTGDCWMQVKDKDGKVLVSGTKKSGDVVELSDSESYHLTLGAPHAVNGTLDGEAIDLSSYSGGRVARLTVPQE